MFTVDYPLTTERLVLRPFTESDFDDLYAIQRDPDTTRYLPYGARSPEEVATALADKMRQTDFVEDNGYMSVAVELPEAGRMIGEIVLIGRDAANRMAEIGYVMHPDYHGKGYATEAAGMILRLAFEQFERHRVIARLDARNTASARVVERLGMRKEAHFVRNEFWKGEWADECVYAMLAEEWAAKR